MKLAELKTDLNQILRRNGVRVAYLFGSQADDTAGPLSDLDIGVLFADSLSAQELFRRRLRLISDLIALFHSHRVDVVVLNQAPPALRFNVIKRGKIVHNEDEALRVRFEERTLNDFFDTEPLRRLYRERLFQAIESGRFYD